jgi:PAS domain-containing protein
VQNEQNVALFPAKPSRARDLIDLQTAVLEPTANAVVITDQTGTVICVNSAFAQLTGYTPAHRGSHGQCCYNSRKNEKPPLIGDQQ